MAQPEGMAMGTEMEMSGTLVVPVHLCRALSVCVFCVHLCCENTGGNEGKEGWEEVNQAK
jgi:hypothetical protein